MVTTDFARQPDWDLALLCARFDGTRGGLALP
jgi:hypothetical protein